MNLCNCSITKLGVIPFMNFLDNPHLVMLKLADLLELFATPQLNALFVERGKVSALR